MQSRMRRPRSPRTTVTERTERRQIMTSNSLTVLRESNSALRRPHTQPRAAGVSPPWFRDTNVVQRETRFVQRLANGRTRAAGVSPPGFGFALATATGFFGLNTSCAAHADVVPRLAYASRSCVAVRMSAGEKRLFPCANARLQERRVSARRGSVIRTLCNGKRALFSD